MTKAGLVIGAGIAGVQAAIDLAEQGFTVYVVERNPSIGGRMAQLDKTFPTLDCAACIMTPKMVDAGRHPNIKLLTYSEVKEVRRAGKASGSRLSKSRGTLMKRSALDVAHALSSAPLRFPTILTKEWA